MLLMMWVESSRCFPVRIPSAWMIRSVVSWKASRPPSCCIRRTRKLCSVFWGRWVSSISSRRAWCQSRLNSSCSRASSSVRLNISLRKWTPEDGLHRSVGTAVVRAVHRSKALLVNQGERLVPENLGPTSLQAPGLLRRNQELGLPQAHLWVSLSEHAHLPRPGAAPRRFPTLSLPCPSLARGFYERIKLPHLRPGKLGSHFSMTSLCKPSRHRITISSPISSGQNVLNVLKVKTRRRHVGN